MSASKEKSKKTRGFGPFNMLYIFCGWFISLLFGIGCRFTITALSVRSDIYNKVSPNELFKITKFPFQKLINLVRLMFRGSDKIVGSNVIYFRTKQASP